MGRKPKFDDGILVNLYMERARVIQLKELAEKGKVSGGYSQLIRDAIDEKYGPMAESSKVYEIPSNMRKAIDVIGLMAIELHSGARTDVFLSKGNLIGITDVTRWSTLEGIMDLAREMLERKGYEGVVVEDRTTSYKVDGAPGRPRLTHEGFDIHGPMETPFKAKDMKKLKEQLESEYKTLGRILKGGER